MALAVMVVLGLDFVLKSLALALMVVLGLGIGLEFLKCLYQPVYCY